MSSRAPLLALVVYAAACGCGSPPPPSPAPHAPTAARTVGASRASRTPAQRESPPPSRCERAQQKLALGSKLAADGFAQRAERLAEAASALCPERAGAAKALIERERHASAAVAKTAGTGVEEVWAAAGRARASGDLARARRLSSLATRAHQQRGTAVTTWSSLGEVGVLALSRDGALLLGNTGPGELVILDGRTLVPKVFVELGGAAPRGRGGATDIRAARFAPGGELVGLVEAGALVLVDVQSGAQKRKLEWSGQSVEDFDFAPDGASVVTASRESFDVIVRRFDVRSGDSMGELRLPGAHSVPAFALSRDGALVAVAGRSGTIELLDAKKLEKKRTLTQKASEGTLALAFSPSGDRLAALSSGASLEVFGTANGKAAAQASLDRPWHTALLGFSADGSRIRVVGGTWGEALVEIDAASGQPLTSRRLLRGRAVLAADGTVVAMSDDRGGISVVDVASGKPIVEALRRESRVEGLALTDGHLAVAREIRGGSDSRVEIFVASVRREPWFASTPGYKAVLAFSPKGQRLAGHFGGNGVRAWEVATGAALDLPDAPEWVDSLAFDGPGRLRGAGGPFELRLFSLDIGAGAWSDDLRLKRESGTRAAALSGKVAVVAGKELLLFDFETKRASELERPKGAESVAVSADSRFLVTVSERGTERSPLPSGRPRQLLSARCKRGPARLSADASAVLVGCSYRDLAVIRATGERAIAWEVSRAELSATGRVLATEHDGRVSVVAGDAKPPVSLVLGLEGAAVATTPSGEIERFGDASDVADRTFCRAGNRAYPFELCEDAFYRDHLLEDALAEAL